MANQKSRNYYGDYTGCIDVFGRQKCHEWNGERENGINAWCRDFASKGYRDLSNDGADQCAATCRNYEVKADLGK